MTDAALDAIADLPHWAQGTIIILAAGLAATVAHAVLRVVLVRLTAHRPLLSQAVARGAGPVRPLMTVIALLMVLPSVPLPPGVLETVHRLLVVGMTGLIGWLAVKETHLLVDWVRLAFPLDRPDNLEARQAHTRIGILRRILMFVIVVLTGVLMLIAFPAMREVGLSLFASAGVAGLVLGMAARPALSNLIAGVQLALTQPIRVDDVVIVEGEWGWIEEITATYVVVRVWDLRRLVVPLSYFIEKPFQNWTRQTSDILGTVFLHADYSLPVGEMRSELLRILEAHPLWDRKVCTLVVTDATDRTIEIRALMSARSSGEAWDLRCDVREKLIDWMRRTHPDSLPRTRAEVEANNAGLPPAPGDG